MDTKRPYFRLKSDWAAAKAKGLWAAARELELTPNRGGNAARKWQSVAQLKREAGYWDMRAERYREQEGRRAA